MNFSLKLFLLSIFVLCFTGCDNTDVNEKFKVKQSDEIVKAKKRKTTENNQ